MDTLKLLLKDIEKRRKFLKTQVKKQNTLLKKYPSLKKTSFNPAERGGELQIWYLRVAELIEKNK